MAKKKRKPAIRNNSSNTIVVKSEPSRSGWFRTVLWIVIISLSFVVISPVVIMIGGWVDDVKNLIKTISGEAEIDPAGDDETTKGQTSQSRVLKAYSLVADLDPEKDMPEDFDQTLLENLEIDAYTRLLVHQNKNGQKTFSLMIKVFEDYALEDPLYIYAYKISKNIVGMDLSQIPWWLWITEGTALLAAIATAPFTAGASIALWVASIAGGTAMVGTALKYDTQAETTWISQDGESWVADNSYNWQSKSFYMLNAKNETVRYKFKSEKKPASIIFDYWNQVTEFEKSNIERFEPAENPNVKHALSVELLNTNGQWISKGDAGMMIEYLNINKDDFKSSNPLSASRFYEIFKSNTKESKYQTLNDGISLQIPSWQKSSEMSIDEFINLEKFGFARFIEYKFNNKLMNGSYRGYAFDEYGTSNSVALSSRLKSKFFSATYKLIKKSEFAGMTSASNARFITEFIPSVGVRIVTLPHSLNFAEGLTVGQYQFQILQKNSSGQILTTQTTQNNLFDGVKVFDNDSSAFLIPLDDNFTLENGVKTIELSIINSIGLTGFSTANSVMEVA